MLRCLTCAAVILVLVLSLCLLPQTATARRCPEKEPETLLSLYQNSNAIYIATFDKIVEGKSLEDTDDYTAVEIKKHFTVSSALKGKSRKFFVHANREYRYKNNANAVNMIVETGEAPAGDADGEEKAARPAGETPAEEPVVPEEEPEEPEEPEELKSGDTVLLFVKSGEEGEEDTLTDDRDGIKRLTMEEIGIYKDRVKELNAIFSAEKVIAEQLIAWLIRCAEHPATRWEGTYELLSSVQQAEWKVEAAKQRSERIAKGEPVEEAPIDDPEAVEEAPAEKVFDTSLFPKALNADHKQTLANILLNSYSPTGSPQKVESVRGDHELIELVKRWGDPRLLGFLLDQLRSGAGENWDKATRMTTIAEILEDDGAKEIASKFSDNAWQEDAEVVDAEDEESADEPAEPAAETEAPAEEDPERPEVPADQAESDASTEEQPKPKRVTYVELRADLLQKFLTQCEKVIADRERAKEEKSA